LSFLVSNRNKILKKEEILNAVWGDDSYFNSRSLDVFVSKLRKYLKSDKRVKINNIHGIGFILTIEE
jgi:DNA-binding response OmpR family regulator